MSFNNSFNNNYGRNFRPDFNGASFGYAVPRGGNAFNRAPLAHGYQKKHSGCTYKENYTTRSGKLKAAIMYGWNYSKQRGGIVKFVGVPAKDTTVKNKSGKDLAKWVVEVQWPNGQKQTMTAFRNRGTGKLTIPDLGMVASPNAPNGGYFGKAYRSKGR